MGLGSRELTPASSASTGRGMETLPVLQQSKTTMSTQKWRWTDPDVSNSLREASLREALRRVGWRRDRAASSARSGEEEEM